MCAYNKPSTPVESGTESIASFLPNREKSVKIVLYSRKLFHRVACEIDIDLRYFLPKINITWQLLS